MTDRPILFSPPMVLALLAGRKTQTRCLAHEKPQVAMQIGDGPIEPIMVASKWQRVKPGDRLWVRERLLARPMGNVLTGEPTKAIVAAYAADDEDVCEKMGFNLVPWWKNGEAKLRPLAAMHMPRRISRLTLTVTDVRVQKVQEITEADARAEGCPPDEADPLSWFCDLWGSLHGSDAWNSNPPIVAISFRCHHSNIDAMEAAT